MTILIYVMTRPFRCFIVFIFNSINVDVDVDVTDVDGTTLANKHVTQEDTLVSM